MTIRLILWDQLSREIPTLVDADMENDLIVFLETMREATYVKHHVKKLTFLFSAMRHFAKELEKEGFSVHYTPITKKEASLTSGIKKIAQKGEAIIVTEPGEYRILEEIEKWDGVEILEDDRFFCSSSQFKKLGKGRMETFYRKMRKESGILLTQEGKPIGGQWNFDKENRNPIKGKVAIPKPPSFRPDTITKQAILDVKKLFPKHFGVLEGFVMPVQRKDAEKLLAHFLKMGLPKFGTYQDAMLAGEPFLFHSLISSCLNAGLLDPSEVCEKVEQAYKAKKVTIANAEGFIRQVLGWREFVRAIYWLYMPKYKEMNYLSAKNPLPDFYWTGKTRMRCLSLVIQQTEEHAYSHHIQRLMVTGNFALLVGVAPKEVCDWYLMVYADAHEWVELPNTLGMSQYADGGVMASKPYIASGSYIHKMSDFCEKCHYNVQEKEGQSACPFNYLYWDFLMRHQKKLKKNVRLAMPYRTLAKFSAEKKKRIRESAQHFIKKINQLP